MILACPVAAQTTTPTPAARPTNPTNPIDCWWKTDRSAVRVGEPFMLTLTCAVLDTERVRVVVDESGLAPSALHLVPFDIVNGQRFRDIQNAPRRFFQYQYTMRVLGEEFFGKEVTLPRLQISYRVQNSLQGGSALAGREAHYSLVPVPIRVLSLVPPGTTQIRDTPQDTFGDVERRLFRSNLLLMFAGVAFVIAALLAALLVARAAVKRRGAVSARRRPVSAASVLVAASRELRALRAASQRDGWTAELAGRAAAAVRLAAAVALSRPVGQTEIDRGMEPGEGQIPAPRGLRNLRRKRIMLSASVTPATAATNGTPADSAIWDSLSRSLAVFAAARYSRRSAAQGGGVDGAALDAALAEGHDAVKRLRFRQWRGIGRLRRKPAPEASRPTWAR